MTTVEAVNSSVRPLTTLMLVGTFCWGFIASRIDDVAFIGVLSAVVTFWYAQRKEEKDETRADKAVDKTTATLETVAAKAEERATKAEEKVAAVLPPSPATP